MIQRRNTQGCMIINNVCQLQHCYWKYHTTVLDKLCDHMCQTKCHMFYDMLIYSRTKHHTKTRNPFVSSLTVRWITSATDKITIVLTYTKSLLIKSSFEYDNVILTNPMWSHIVWFICNGNTRRLTHDPPHNWCEFTNDKNTPDVIMASGFVFTHVTSGHLWIPKYSSCV
jgi:hypothetical protein